MHCRTFSELSNAEDQYSFCRELCHDLAQDLLKEELKVQGSTRAHTAISQGTATYICHNNKQISYPLTVAETQLLGVK